MILNQKVIGRVKEYFYEGIFSGFINGYANLTEFEIQNTFKPLVVDEIKIKSNSICSKYEIENLFEELNILLLVLHETRHIFNNSSIDPPNFSVEEDTENYKALVELMNRVKPYRFNNEPLEDGFAESIQDPDFEVEEIIFKLKGKINLRIRSIDIIHELVYRIKTSNLQFHNRFFLSQRLISIERKHIAKCLQNLIVGETQYSISKGFKTSNEICRIIFDIFSVSGFINSENISSYDADYIRKFLSTYNEQYIKEFLGLR